MVVNSELYKGAELIVAPKVGVIMGSKSDWETMNMRVKF